MAAGAWPACMTLAMGTPARPMSPPPTVLSVPAWPQPPRTHTQPCTHAPPTTPACPALHGPPRPASPQVRWKVSTQTSDIFGAGTDAKVWVQLHGPTGMLNGAEVALDRWVVAGGRGAHCACG